MGEVTRDGLREARGDREAVTGAAPAAVPAGDGQGNGHAARHRAHDDRAHDDRAREERPPAGWDTRRRGRREEFTSYYGRPILHEPTWSARDIAGYLFLGGLAGASSVLAAGASATGRPGLARSAKVGAAGAIGLSLAALVHDLGRPSRFVNMLRVFKPTSPMSVGSWLLSAYAPMAGAAAASAVTGRLPRIGALATGGAAVLGPGVAAYTAVLLGDTAVPAWHDGYRQLPYAFVGSAASSAAGLGLLAAPAAENGPARRLAVLGATVELTSVSLLHRTIGPSGEVYRKGRAGALMRAAEVLTAAGVVGAATRRGGRALAAASGLALLAGSACARLGIFAAGKESARDPKYTIVPQRERLNESKSAG